MQIPPVDLELLLKAFDLGEGEKLFVQVYSKSEGGMRQRELLKAKIKLAVLYPDECAMIKIRHTKIKGKFYVYLEKAGKASMMAYKEQVGGYKPIKMSSDAELKRRIKLMIEDGYSKEQILDLEGQEAEKYFENF